MSFIKGYLLSNLFQMFSNEKKEEPLEVVKERNVRDRERRTILTQEAVLSCMEKLFKTKEEISCSDIAKELEVESKEITPILIILQKKRLVKKNDYGYYTLV